VSGPLSPQDADLFFWLLARVAGIASFTALSVAVLSGIALRTSVLDWLGTNRALKSLHTFSTVLWIPLGLLHVATLLLDRTAQVRPLDLVVPFEVPYARQAIGFGTLAFDIFVVVTVTSWAKRAMDYRLWSWIHRSSYLAFALTFAHAVLSGTDFSSPVISALAWSSAFAVLLLSLARLAWGRLPQ